MTLRSVKGHIENQLTLYLFFTITFCLHCASVKKVTLSKSQKIIIVVGWAKNIAARYDNDISHVSKYNTESV